ncbi:protein translocase subunit SecD [Patescibacteria group bacterium]|nr:protein translocase subunit SecD [Patescibacteria group bacterium]MBU1895385.1 protein translocase subunit SecD [Patescibacteria group bacterium]
MSKNKMKNPKSSVRSKVRWGIVGILALLLVSSFFDAPTYANRVIDTINNTVALGIPRIPDTPFRLGLDLQGGAHLIYQADTNDIEAGDRAAAVEGVRDVIERRVNATGVGEPSVRTAKVGEDFRINVELPGITDINEAIKMIGQTPTLEFKEENTVPARDLTEEEELAMEEYNKDAKERADVILKRIKDGEDFETLAKEVSEDDLTKNNGGYLNFISRATADPVFYSWAEENKEGNTSKVVENNEGYNILKLGKEQVGGEEVRASHILICYLGSQNCEAPIYTKDEAFQKAQEIFDLATASNFSDLAQENSTDPGSKDNGGDLGFFTKDTMVAEFSNAVFSVETGEIVGPIETQFGYHIIYKTDKRETIDYELWRILIETQQAIDILPSEDPWMSTGLSGSQLDRAEVLTNPQTGAIEVSLQFDSEGTDLFRDITERNLNKPVAIFLDGQPISIPNVNSVIPNGKAVISGGFDLTEAKLLSQRLNAGALPVPINLISQQSIGASLGAESLAKSLQAGIVALIIVMIFMLLYYRLPGLLAILALTVYLSLTLAVFKLIGVTLTLAGIAGFILSIGMAVDANVLIFERLKEELRSGKSLKAAVEEGFLRAWTSIRDGNISTLITCVLLVWFGSSFVQGFAITLAIGVLLSMFSAVTITRVMLRFVVPWFKEEGNLLFLGYKKINNNK